jgi:radical SAM superfamily enzyme YgiQ (UPF0313 family)
MYFIVGLPGESDDDLHGIVQLVRDAAAIVRQRGRERGRVGTVNAGASILVPKPYTPYQVEPMLNRHEAGRRLDILWDGMQRLDNVKFDRPSYREALWQGFLSRGDCGAIDVLDRVASGEQLGRVITSSRNEIEAAALPRIQGSPVWRFISSAPSSSVIDFEPKG